MAPCAIAGSGCVGASWLGDLVSGVLRYWMQGAQAGARFERGRCIFFGVGYSGNAAIAL